MPVTRSGLGKEKSSPGASTTMAGTETSDSSTARTTYAMAQPGEAALEVSSQQSAPRSRKSTSSRKQYLATLHAEEKIIELRAAEEVARAARELAEVRFRQMQAMDECDSTDEVEDDLASVRINTWLREPQPSVGQDKPSDDKPNEVRENRSVRDGRGVQRSCAERIHGPRAERKLDAPRLATDTENLTTARSITRVDEGKFRFNFELPEFHGHHYDWLAFRSAFEDSESAFSRAENVMRLQKCLRGPAKECVSFILANKREPQAVMRALELRFGRPESLIMAELDKLKQLPRLAGSDREVCIFACKIINVVATVEAMGKEAYLHSPEMSRAILDKLTPIMRSNYYRFERSCKDDMPMLKKISAFLEEEAEMCSRHALPEQIYEGESKGRQGNRRPQKAFVAAVSKVDCPVCKKGHPLISCPDFIGSSIERKWEIVRKSLFCFLCLKEKHKCKGCKAPLCDKDGCGKRHHRTLHYGVKVIEHVTPRLETAASVTTDRGTRHAYLKIVPIELSTPSKMVSTYALLDEGSTLTFIDESLAQALCVKGPTNTLWLKDANGGEARHERSQRISLRVKGKHAASEYIMHDAQTVRNLNFTKQTVPRRELEDCHHLSELIDELTYDDAEPKVIIGQDNWHLIVSRKIKEGHDGQPVASLTHLGWVLHGNVIKADNKVSNFCGHVSSRLEEDLEEMMRDYFKLESIGIGTRRPSSDPEEQAIKILERTSQRRPDGRFEAGLLWRDQTEVIPNNYVMAVKRLKNLESKLDKDSELTGKYFDRVENLITAGYAERTSTPGQVGRTWYLPHFAVVNPAKSKIRLVHDAAAKYAGKSLNDRLLSGPDLLQSLPGVIMRFRQYPVAVSADIKEMFMQVKVRTEDRDALRFLWRGERREGPPDEYRMTSVIFGATSSPSTALYVKNKNAEDHKGKYPAAAAAIVRNHYMDDYLDSFQTVEEASKVCREVDYVHKQAGFELRGWAATHDDVVRDLVPAEEATVVIGGSGAVTEKALGLHWRISDDTISYQVNMRKTPPEVAANARPPTKREALSVIMALFDPLGLVSPITTPAKRLMQEVWRYGTSWDDPLPAELRHTWSKWYESLRDVEQVRIPRCYDAEPAATTEIHTFVDASEEAYATAVYWRKTRADGSVSVILAAGKSRVAPLRPVSIPRLELQAALLGARLAATVVEEHDWDVARRVYWSDSRTALAWIRSEPRSFKTFVAHRLAEIEDLTKKNEWRWVPTADNVADDATRATPEEFTSQHRWFKGPAFLYHSEETWPVETRAPTGKTGEEREEKCHAAVAKVTSFNNDHLPNVDRFSSWLRLIRTTARVLQFVDRCRDQRVERAAALRKRTRANAEKDPAWTRNQPKTVRCKYNVNKNRNNRRFIGLEAHYLIAAERLWIKASQRDSFASDIQRLATRAPPSGNDRLAALSTVIGEDGVLRLKGRISETPHIEAETASPAILDGKHPYVRLYIQHVHEKMHHGGVETVTNELRTRVWIVKTRPAVRDAIRSCMVCRLKKAKAGKPATGDLPAARLTHHTRPFSHSGVDYFGPMTVTVGRRHEKRYVGLFTCLSSRAVHLEVVHSLSVDSAICALRRFCARRGCPTEIWSDNATCFHGAEKELQRAIQNGLQLEAANRLINWRFIPPAAPFMGGAWERMVRSVKEALRHTLNEKAPSDETLATLLAEVENTVNSRPLTHVAVDPDEPEALTPNHILLGVNHHVPVPGTFTENDESARQHWRRAQFLADTFWRRWVREYLPMMQHRREPASTGRAPNIGDLVLIADENSPRNTWPRGVITRTFPGKDGQVRVVDLRTSGGHILRRPTRKVVVLPIGREIAPAGECARRPNTRLTTADHVQPIG